MRANDDKAGQRGKTHAVVGLVIGAMVLAVGGPAWAIDVGQSRRWALAQSGQGQSVLVSADPGVGKSRLCHEFIETIRAPGVAEVAVQEQRERRERDRSPRSGVAVEAVDLPRSHGQGEETFVDVLVPEPVREQLAAHWITDVLDGDASKQFEAIWQYLGSRREERR